jgi:ubiquinone/menaquinone biosynthesis C-methylase UbiE
MDEAMNRMSKEQESAAERLRRSDYKKVWSSLSDTVARAKMHVAGTEDEELLTTGGRYNADSLRRKLGINPADTVLEIGCGVGRLAPHLAPFCRHWIGCDVSPNMLKFARERLVAVPNIQLVETSGYDLAPIESRSIDAVYCTVVFMHLDEWERYGYVLEAFRVLRPGGRLCVDNVNLCSDKGWAVFETHRKFSPAERPPQITTCSTPAELQEYLKRAGFEQIETEEDRAFVSVWGRKPVDSSGQA